MSASNKAIVPAYILAEITFKPPGAGGRSAMPIDSGYAPYLRSGLTTEDLAVRVNNVPEGTQFGQVITVVIELSYYPRLGYGSLKEGVPLQLIEGQKVVATGICKSSIVTS